MASEFARVLQGLMQNRGLSRLSLALATGRSESTIHSLMTGGISPTSDLLHEIASVLQLDPDDLFVISDMPLKAPRNNPPTVFRSDIDMRNLIAAASRLPSDEIKNLTEMAKRSRPANG